MRIWVSFSDDFPNRAESIRDLVMWETKKGHSSGAITGILRRGDQERFGSKSGFNLPSYRGGEYVDILPLGSEKRSLETMEAVA